jgi:hypothetical protein
VLVHPDQMASGTPTQKRVSLTFRPERRALCVKMDQVPVIPRRIAVFGNHSGPVAFVERLTVCPAKLTHSACTSIHAVALCFLLGWGQLASA